MASVFTNINQARLDDKVIEALRHVRVMLDMISYRVIDETRQVGNVVKVMLSTDPTVDTKTPGAEAAATGALTGVDVTLDQFKQATWEAIEGNIDPATLPLWWEEQAAGGVANMAHKVITTALGRVTKANYGDTAADKLVVAPASFMQEDLALLWAKATKKIKGQKKTFVMDTDYAGNILAQPGLGLVFAQTGNNIVSTGVLPMLMGMGVAHYGEMPDNTENLGGAVIGRAALAVAIAQPGFFLNSGDGDIKERRVISDPESGLACTYTVTAKGAGKMVGEISCLFGTAKAQNAIVRLVKA